MRHKYNITGPLNEPDKYLPSVSVDCAIFGFHDKQLKVLLIRFKNTDLWALPGGYIRMEEDMDEAATRILEERTAVEDIFLEQFYTFGQRHRVDRSVQEKILDAIDVPLLPDAWISRRFVSVGYYALVDFTKVTPTTDMNSDACDWCSLDELPPLMFDHSLIIQKALQTLRSRLDHGLIGPNLLPDGFTMQELQSLYETILGKKLLRTNFQRKILSLGILERMEKRYSGRAHKAPYAYRFNLKKGQEFFME